MHLVNLAERLAPKLASLNHPGDAEHDPFPLIIPSFQTALLPEGMAAEDAAQLGMPSPDIALHFLEALFELIRIEGGPDLNDPELMPKRQAEIKAELAQLREIAEPKATAFKKPKGVCGGHAGRVMARDLHTDEPVFPCEMLVHKCSAKQR